MNESNHLRPDPSGRYARTHDVVWRSGPDRVLIQRVAAPAEAAATELLGDVAYVWLALDTPATSAELAQRLADAAITVADLDADVRYLAEHRLVVAVPGRPDGTMHP